MDQWNRIYKREGTSYQYYDIAEPHQDMQRVAAFLKSRGARKVLDLGCGAGRNSLYLARQGFEVSGIDIAPEGLKIMAGNLEKEGLNADLKRGDVFARLPYQDGTFDAVISVQVLQHAREKQIRAAIGEIWRILKLDGIIFITLCGRTSQGKVRPMLVKTARKVAPNTYVPTQGNEVGLTHFIYSKRRIQDHYRGFKPVSSWRDDKDYYCFMAIKRKK